ncbi:LysR family transcriptional regulator [Klebsiella pneumoniae]|uniref:LysR family transcriptional regulator n=1 Tax=Klebsiella pneumoniae TaxID=573 RepID=A0A447S871_KLEPN|nr:LysR family transcriptional regulator [Klebsiella pneumoniae]
MRSRWLIALPRDNPLRRSRPLALEQLRDVAPILFPREVAPGLYELVYNSCLRAGIDMARAWQSSQISSSLSMGQCRLRLRAGSAVDDLHPAAERQLSPLSGAPLKTDIAIAWRRFGALAYGETLSGDVLIFAAPAAYCATQPPSMFHAAPRTWAAASLHRNSAISPSCCG